MTEKVKIKVENTMFETYINTPDGRYNLLRYVSINKVINRVIYYNLVEVLLPKKKRTLESGYFEIKKVCHNYGLIFNNGFEIKNVQKQIFNFFDTAEIIERRERV